MERAHKGLIQGLNNFAMVTDRGGRDRASDITSSQYLFIQWWGFEELWIQHLWNAKG